MKHFVPIVGSVVALLGALLVAFAVAWSLPSNVLYPDFCHDYPTADGIPTQSGQFCLRWDEARGQYEAPPAGVPGDVAYVATMNVRPGDARLAAWLVTFAGTFAGCILLVAFAARLPRKPRVTLRDAD
jgi:hypothetical protein